MTTVGQATEGLWLRPDRARPALRCGPVPYGPSCVEPASPQPGPQAGFLLRPCCPLGAVLLYILPDPTRGTNSRLEGAAKWG